MATSFGEILSTVIEEEKTHQDLIIPTNHIILSDKLRVALRSAKGVANLTRTLSAAELDDNALGQALNRLGIPVRHGRRLAEEAPKLLAMEFNHFIQNESGNTMLRLKRHTSGATVRGFLTDKYTKLDNIQIVESLSEVFGAIDDFDVQSFHMSDGFFHIRVVFPNLSTKLGKTVHGVNDIITVGADVWNSEVGRCSVGVGGLVYRKVCTNGLKVWQKNSDEDANYRYRHLYFKQDELTNKLKEAISSSIESGNDLVKTIRTDRLIHVNDPQSVIDKLSKEGGYSQKFAESVRDSFSQESESTQWGVVNAFTRAAQTLPLERRLDVERFAGQIATMTL